MPVWKPESVTNQPISEVYEWTISEIVIENDINERYVIGMVGGEGRVSSKIISHHIDNEEHVVVTRSGRQYKLMGNPGTNSDAMYVWGIWCDYNKVTHWIDVSDQYV